MSTHYFSGNNFSNTFTDTTISSTLTAVSNSSLIPNLNMGRPRTSSTGSFTRERCLYVNVAGNKTSFGVIMVNPDKDNLDYVRRYMTKRFWRELSGRNWG